MGQGSTAVTVGVAVAQQLATRPTVTIARMTQSRTGSHLITGHRIPLGTVRVAVGQARVLSVMVGQVSAAKVAIGRRLFRKRGSVVGQGVLGLLKGRGLEEE